MKLTTFDNTKEDELLTEADNSIIEDEIGRVLTTSGIERGSAEWNKNMAFWKGRRKSNPRAYDNFVNFN